MENTLSLLFVRAASSVRTAHSTGTPASLLYSFLLFRFCFPDAGALFGFGQQNERPINEQYILSRFVLEG